MTLPRALLLLFLSLGLSCDFVPEGTVFTNIDPPSAQGLRVNLNDYPDPEILLKQKTTFTYSVETAGKQLLESTVLLNEKIIWVTSSHTTSFELDPAAMITASYNLKILFVVPSGTGSLAEKAGAEVLLVWTERTIIVDNEIHVVAITAVENVDYSIKVSWEEYPKFNFQQYEVTRDDYDENGGLVGGRVFPPITSPGQTSLTDGGYIGGKSIYKLKLAAAGKTIESPGFTYQHPYKPLLSASVGSGGNVTISWNSLSALRNNFYKYKLEIIEEVGGFNQSTTFEKMSVDDTTLVTTIPNFIFGKSRKLKLIMSTPASSFYTKVYERLLNFGERFPFFLPYIPLAFDPVSNNYFLFKSKGTYPRLCKVNVAGEAIDSLDKYYDYISINSGTAAVGSLAYKNYLINLNTMTEEKTLDIPDANVITLSDDNKVMVFTMDAGVKVFSEAGQELMAAGFVTSVLAISMDGQYSSASNRLYKYNGTTFDLWSFINPIYQVISITFLPTDPATMITGFPDKIVKFNLVTRANELISTDYSGPCNFDPVSNKIGCHSTNTFFVVNPEDLSLHKSLEVESGNVYILLNERIICPGSQIKLSDIP